jgi:peroxiredoxin
MQLNQMNRVRPIVLSSLIALTLAAGLTRPSFGAPEGAAAPAAIAPAASAPTRNIAKWNLDSDDKLAVSGYDPVSYFPEGGGKPVKGDKKFVATVGGVKYQFASAKNRDAFNANPSKYEPAYGGWCAWAVRDGEQVEVDPKSFIVRDNRLFLFYDGFFGDTRSKWLKLNHAQEEAKANTQWKKISGENAPMPMADKPAAGTLKVKLDDVSAKYAAKITPEQSAAQKRGIEEVRASLATTKKLGVGDLAPSFELPDANGKPASLKSMLAQGPVVVTFYRGGWCPYCNIQLHEYQQILPEIKAMGAQLVAISPEKPDQSLSTAEKNKLEFSVLSDAGSKAADTFGIAYELTPSIAPMAPMLKKHNAEGTKLPLSATYVINRDGKIAYAFVNEDYRVRAEPTEILAALKSLSSTK